jgi:ribulose-5-phosphate 4-epimerase/fuculose-1-phosphate aldolase
VDVADSRFRIAAARRMLARNGCESMVAGHVSERAADADSFWISPFEYFDETLPDRIIRLGLDMTLLDGDWEPSPAVQFHAAIYQQRPDVGAIVHTHSTYISAFVTRPEEVAPLNIVGSLFTDDQVVFIEDGLAPPVDGKSVAAAFGDDNTLLISNHGVILIAATLEQATMRAVFIEQAARFHIEATIAGGSPIAPASVPLRRKFLTETAIPLMWQANLRRLHTSDPDLFLAR